MTQTFKYDKMKKIADLRVSKAINFINNRFYSYEYIINGNMKVTAVSGENVHVREIASGSFEAGSIIYKDTVKVIYNVADLKTIAVYQKI